MRQLGSFFHIAMNGMAASDKIFRLLDLPEHKQEVSESFPSRHDIVCSGLRFSYEPDREILLGVDYGFSTGQLYGLVGESGCGKSTVASILMGRNKGYTGSVTIGGVELKGINESSLLRNITYVSHQSYLFKGTVRDNLLMGKPSASDDELWAVLERVNLSAFLKAEQGLDTPLLEKAANLSGGQCQRLALARALLHDSPVYIFDEATSNIDVESENDIMAEIHRLARTKTVILISHRLANVVQADNIYVLDGGIIAEHGSHEELLKNHGLYEKLWNAQQALENYGKEGDVQMKRRSGFQVMARLIGLVKPLTGFMFLAVLMGLIGHLCAAFITIFGGYAVLEALHFDTPFTLTALFVCVVVFAIVRGFLRYAEQACNHFIAFKLLALLRDKVFRALRRLAPAKLEGRDKGDLISVITSDIELLEVFYAHTISPAAIAFLFTIVMCLFIGSYHWLLGLIALAAYLTVGIVIPLVTSKLSGDDGMKFRTKSGSFPALCWTACGAFRKPCNMGRAKSGWHEMNEKTDDLAKDEERMKRTSGRNSAVTNTVVLAFDLDHAVCIRPALPKRCRGL